MIEQMRVGIQFAMALLDALISIAKLKVVLNMSWTQKLATGIEWQDADHRELLSQMSLLLGAMKKSAAKTEILKIIDFLDQYARQHLAREEVLMREFNLPGATAHIQAHNEFKKRILEFIDLYDRQGGSSYVVMHVQKFMHDWFIQHIQDTDKKMASHYLMLIHSE
jgi:hemerythrin